jgi:hypothetical protein
MTAAGSAESWQPVAILKLQSRKGTWYDHVHQADEQ